MSGLKGLIGLVYFILGFIAYVIFSVFILHEDLFSSDPTSQKYASWLVRLHNSNPKLVTILGSAFFGYAIYIILGMIFETDTKEQEKDKEK